jgi:hypothetical protein
MSTTVNAAEPRRLSDNSILIKLRPRKFSHLQASNGSKKPFSDSLLVLCSFLLGVCLPAQNPGQVNPVH